MMQASQEPTPVEPPAGDAVSQQSRDRRKILGIVLIALVLFVIVGAAIYGMASHPEATSVLRDMSIIALALVTLVIGLFLVVLIFQLQSLIVLLRDEIKPILDSANETANTVRGTTTFVSDAVVTPLIHVASVASGVGQTFKTLKGTGRKRKPQTETKADSIQK